MMILETAPLLQATRLCKSFAGFPAVKNVSFCVRHGEAVAIIGPNGAGKSTLFDLLTGIKTPDSGEVHLFGQSVTDEASWKRVKRGLGRSFQVSSVFPSFTAQENIQIGLLLASGRSLNFFHKTSNSAKTQAEEILEKVGLTGKRSVLAGELSYGDQRTLELAVTLSTKPQLLLLDEPTAGMAREESRECLRLIKAIASTENIPVVFVEHDMEVVFSFATRVIVLLAGELLIDAEPQVVRSDSRVRDAYFGEAI
jgi:branched-chain amino acid transport system ATP-binding protein